MENYLCITRVFLNKAKAASFLVHMANGLMSFILALFPPLVLVSALFYIKLLKSC